MPRQFCKVCSGQADAYTEVVIRGRHHSYVHCCRNCGFVFIHPVYWLKEAYNDAIASTDVGYVSRNIAASEFLCTLLGQASVCSDLFVDFGGGYGLLVRLMRDKGFHFHLYERHAQNLFARNCDADLARFGPYKTLTAIEVFEHLHDPGQSIAEMLNWSRCIVFTTELCPVARPRPDEWWYFGLDHGQHISFYSSLALELLATQQGLEYHSLGGSWHALAPHNDPILSQRKLSESSLNFTRLGFARLARQLAARLASQRHGMRKSLVEHDFQAVKRIIGMSSEPSGGTLGHVDEIRASR
jgi:hypothetical protein